MSKHNIGFSEIGGYFIGQNIVSDFHQHHAIAIILSVNGHFQITRTGHKTQVYTGVIIQKDVHYSFKSLDGSKTVFIHLDPYSEVGLSLTHSSREINELDISIMKEQIESLVFPNSKVDNDPKFSENLLVSIAEKISESYSSPRKIDERILSAIRSIKASSQESYPLDQAASAVHLSPSRFAHLFKQETGLTFRKFVLHTKLVKSLYAMYQNQNLTEASFLGGFSDQPHFTRTFKRAFGIKPSESKK